MTEPKVPTQEVYAREALYMESLSRHSEDFDKLLASIPVGRDDLKQTLQTVYNIEPDRLLSREKLAKLKEDNRPLFEEVSKVYESFLETELGFN